MKTLLKHIILLLILAFSGVGFSQMDSVFWFAAPEITQDDAYLPGPMDRPIKLNIFSFSNNSINVTISQPTNPLFSPIVNTIPANGHLSIDLTSIIDMIENKPANSVLPYGLLIKANGLVSIYYGVIWRSGNTENYSLKGINALGTNFMIPGQTDYQNYYYHDNPPPLNRIDIVATENNTVVSITPSKGIAGHPANVMFTKNLNRGETYCCAALGQLANQHLEGTIITSNYPIAITMTDDLLNFFNGTGIDLTGDQIVPVNVIGREYIAVKGTLVNNADRIYILATQNNTSIYVSGSTTPITTINKGQTYSLSFPVGTNAVYFTASQPVYTYQLTGLRYETGSALLPTIECTGTKIITYLRKSRYVSIVNIIVPAQGINSFLFNGSSSVITAGGFSPVPGTGNQWYYATIDISSLISQNQAFTINNSVPFHMGVFEGTGNRGVSYAFISDYAPYTREVIHDTICTNNAYKNGRFNIPANKLQTAGVFEFRDTIPNPTGCDSIIILNLTVEACCQTELKTVIFKPDAAVGQDANIATSYACTMQGNTQPHEFLNGGNGIEFDVIDWTYTSQGCSKATTRSLLKFDELSTIPANAVIIRAELKLYGVQSSSNFQGNSCYPGSPSLYANNCPNKAFIQRVTSTWNEQTVTWNTQPNTDTTNQITIPQTTSQWNWNFADSSVNLVTMVQNWVNNPSTNFGFMLRLETEAYYRSILFASSDHPNSALHPELIITYEVRKSGYSDTTKLNATICKGDIYNKNGFNESASGIYTQNLQKRLGCDSIVILTLKVIEKETHTIDAVICYGDVYQANGFNVSNSGTYYDTLQNRFGCDSIVILNLYVASQDTNQIFDTICDGNVYQKNGFTISDSGTYIKKMKNNFGCDSTVILNLTVKPTPDIEIIAIGDNFCEKDMIVLQIITNGDDFLWSTGSLDNPLTITKAGTYTATAKIENCEKSASYTIEDCPCEVWLPNTFTPNNDKINDDFYPVVYSTLNSFSMYIYDRWGQIIFKTDVYASWDGTVNGRSASAGVYYCVLSYSCANDPSKIHHKQGSITLMR